MIIDKYRKAQRLLKARSEPCFHFTEVPIFQIIEEIRNAHFPMIDSTIDLYFVKYGSLAYMVTEGKKSTIYIHQILNHWQTPEEVFKFVCKHELLHLIVKPRIIDGKEKSHPPEFWEREKLISPEKDDAWVWIWSNYIGCLKKRPRLEQIDVLPAWKKRWYDPKYSIDESYKLYNIRKPICDEYL